MKGFLILAVLILSGPNHLWAQEPSLYDRSFTIGEYPQTMPCAPLVSEMTTFTAFLKGFDAKAAMIDTHNWTNYSLLRFVTSGTWFDIGNEESPMSLIQGISASAILGLSKAAVQVYSNFGYDKNRIPFESAAVLINRRYALVAAGVESSGNALLNGRTRFFFCAGNEFTKDPLELITILQENHKEIQYGVETLLGSPFAASTAFAGLLASNASQPAFPHLQELLQKTGLYDSNGSLISGTAVRNVGKTFAAGAIAIQTLRMLTASVTKNPALAALAIPAPDQGITINTKRLGIRSEELKTFLKQDGATQINRCTHEASLKQMCSALTDLDLEIAFAQGQAT